jgi:hypothetical protein
MCNFGAIHPADRWLRTHLDLVGTDFAVFPRAVKSPSFTFEETPMLNSRRRNRAARSPGKPDGVIVFNTDVRNWRDRVRALKALQDAQRSKPDELSGKLDHA